MAWLTGTSTWGNIASDLTKLMCGEMSSNGNSASVPPGDQWIRDIDGSHDVVRTPASQDVSTGSISNRCGYFAALGGSSTTAYPQTSVCKVTGTTSGAPSTSHGNYALYFHVNTANSVASAYNTAVIGFQCWDTDNGTSFSNTTFSPASGGTTTQQGVNLTFSDPSGILQLNASWVRLFTTTYPYGIDFWPMYYRRANSASVSFSVSPPGVQNTDWQLVEQSSQAGNNPNIQYRGGFGFGMGIMTATGLDTNPLYTVSFPMALHKLRMFQNTSTGSIALDYGAVRTDANSNLQNVGGVRFTSWTQIFSTPATPTNSTAVSFWMSVKATGIVVIVSGDPGSTGHVACNHVTLFTPYDTTYDVFPIMTCGQAQNYTGDLNPPTWDQFPQYGRAALKSRQDGSESPRDWQTKWMRSDAFTATPGADDPQSGWSGSNTTDTGSGLNYLYVNGMTQSTNQNTAGINPPRTLKPNPIDTKWWFYTPLLEDIVSTLTDSSNNNVPERITRGTWGTGRTLWLPGDFWASGDELTDTNTSNVWYLVTADYHGILGRTRVSSSVFAGGTAVLET